MSLKFYRKHPCQNLCRQLTSDYPRTADKFCSHCWNLFYSFQQLSHLCFERISPQTFSSDFSWHSFQIVFGVFFRKLVKYILNRDDGTSERICRLRRQCQENDWSVGVALKVVCKLGQKQWTLDCTDIWKIKAVTGVKNECISLLITRCSIGRPILPHLNHSQIHIRVVETRDSSFEDFHSDSKLTTRHSNILVFSLLFSKVLEVFQSSKLLVRRNSIVKQQTKLKPATN